MKVCEKVKAKGSTSYNEASTLRYLVVASSVKDPYSLYPDPDSDFLVNPASDSDPGL
jgi:hypothetical protein